MGIQIDIPTSNEWHILKGESQFGPYTYEEMIQMLQNKTLFEFDYAWSPHLESWTTVSDLPEFSHDRMTRLAEKAKEMFNKRSSLRVAVSLEVLCHDNNRLWGGTCENLSAGGALISMKNPLLLPGHMVTIHFRAKNQNDHAFNCVAEILTKRLTKKRIEHDTSIHYAVKFVQILPVGEGQVNKWVEENKLKQV